MYLVLLVFGVVLTVAGIAIGTSGLSISDHSFDATLVTPAVIAVVGGLILIGLAQALRALWRIELALTARPMPRAIRSSEPAIAAAAPEVPAEPQRVAMPPKPAVQQPVASPPAEARQAKGIDPAKLKFPTMARLEGAEPVHAASAAAANEPPAGDEIVGEVFGAPPVKYRNGGGTTKVVPRLDPIARPAPPRERAKGPAFDTFWPKGPRPSRAAQSPVPVIPAAIAPEPTEPSAAEETAVPAQDGGSGQLSVLKSGLVDGMAYTLFSDGSIEAQLPQGTLRFGSITELRHHIEQSPPEAAAS